MIYQFKPKKKLMKNQHSYYIIMKPFFLIKETIIVKIKMCQKHIKCCFEIFLRCILVLDSIIIHNNLYGLKTQNFG